MLSRRVTAALLTTFATTLTAQSPLITPVFPFYAGADNALYFDLTLHTDVTFTMFELNVRIAGLAGTVDVYARPGTCVGFEHSSAGWTLVGSANAVSNGQEVPTPVDFAASATGSITMTAGSYGMAVGVTGMGPHCFLPVNGTNNIASNHEISLTGRTSSWILFSNAYGLNPNAPGIALHYNVPSRRLAAT